MKKTKRTMTKPTSRNEIATNLSQLMTANITHASSLSDRALWPLFIRRQLMSSEKHSHVHSARSLRRISNGNGHFRHLSQQCQLVDNRNNEYKSILTILRMIIIVKSAMTTTITTLSISIRLLLFLPNIIYDNTTSHKFASLHYVNASLAFSTLNKSSKYRFNPPLIFSEYVKIVKSSSVGAYITITYIHLILILITFTNDV